MGWMGGGVTQGTPSVTYPLVELRSVNPKASALSRSAGAILNEYNRVRDSGTRPPGIGSCSGNAGKHRADRTEMPACAS